MRVLDIPGYVEALAQESLVRDVSLLGVRENLNGFECLPFTLRHFLLLKIARSPLLFTDEVPTLGELIQFLWAISPKYCVNRRKKKRFEKFCRFLNEPQNFAITVDAAKEYIQEAFQDRPPQPAFGMSGPDYYSDGVSIIAPLAREYGWTCEMILNMPLKLSFQFLKEIREHIYASHGQTPLMWNPSDRIKSEWLVKQSRTQN